MFPAAQIILKSGILPSFPSNCDDNDTIIKDDVVEVNLDDANISQDCEEKLTDDGNEKNVEIVADPQKGDTKSDGDTPKTPETDPGLGITVREIDPEELTKWQADYQKALKGKQVDLLDGLKDHHYTDEEEAGASNVARLTKISRDIKEMTTLLPYDFGHSCFIRIDKKKMQYSRAVIFGAHDTPYAHGGFLYDIFVEESYPDVPPKVNIMTTGGGTLRFNPNLYESGLVCLSLLGTWEAEYEDQKWNATTSNMGQVLLSIQSLVMNENVIENEPDYEWASSNANEAYSNIIKFGNVKFAMIDMIKNPPEGFEKIIKTHFYYKREQILADVEQWITEAKDLSADDYGDLVSDHNYDLSSQFQKPYGYKKALIEQYEILKNLLSELTLD
eukprot:CAMPEP_0115037534 /NCGR_PEP_ID=MMETSP0216-20121206/42858_1 /TAXON_ID=223996 /ORGANISM="Protocruzia adherens, Strain Boccale" /LENGTH=387 /DNA_ID=CAMNT_0002417737 /DNA_START=159 /DNA_END=1322 /DNA_ORIENTATION=+